MRVIANLCVLQLAKVFKIAILGRCTHRILFEPSIKVMMICYFRYTSSYYINDLYTGGMTLYSLIFDVVLDFINSCIESVKHCFIALPSVL